jgi:N-acetylated-alpha-linked acidic dipeptidase
VVRDVTDPEKDFCVGPRSGLADLNGSQDVRHEAGDCADLRISAWPGPDYTAFLTIGVASFNLGYGGEGETGGVYHSIYDSSITIFDSAIPTQLRYRPSASPAARCCALPMLTCCLCVH